MSIGGSSRRKQVCGFASCGCMYERKNSVAYIKSYEVLAHSARCRAHCTHNMHCAVICILGKYRCEKPSPRLSSITKFESFEMTAWVD